MSVADRSMLIAGHSLSPSRTVSGPPAAAAYVSLAEATGIRLTFANGVNTSWADSQPKMDRRPTAVRFRSRTRPWTTPTSEPLSGSTHRTARSEQQVPEQPVGGDYREYLRPPHLGHCCPRPPTESAPIRTLVATWSRSWNRYSMASANSLEVRSIGSPGVASRAIRGWRRLGVVRT